ncbi:MAG: hypothetical protein M1819_002243 [Sarea resinae]|nr:MAG: hypothetical protein M1819_002243 [Sarea resinae]
MTTANSASRDGLLVSKRAEIAGLVSSRKRKLRELFAVARSAEREPVPQLASDNLTHAEQAFLDANDLQKGRFFAESTLPTRHQFVLNINSISKPADQSQASPNPPNPQPNSTQSPLSAEKKEPWSQGIAGAGADRGATGHDVAVSAADNEPSRGGQSDQVETVASTHREGQSRDVSPALDSVIDRTTDGVKNNPPASATEPTLPTADTEHARIDDVVESPAGSPGIQPAKAIPLSPEEVASLPGKITTSGLEGDQKAARTVHLPPKENQEQHLRDVDRGQGIALRREQKEDEQRPTSAGLQTMSELMSSPSSTVGPYSTNTPAMNGPSPLTSPENDTTQTKIPGEDAATTAEHDSLLKSQMKVAREAAFVHSPTTADEQLRLEEQQAARASTHTPSDNAVPSTVPESVPTADEAAGPAGNPPLTEKATEIAKDIMEDEDAVDATQTEENGSAEKGQGCGAQSQLEVSGNTSLTPSQPTAKSADSKMDVDEICTPGNKADDGQGTSEGMKSAKEEPEKSAQASPLDQSSASSIAKPAMPHAKSLPSPSAQSPPERMTTRVSSGAIRHKSVSEILGEAPKISLPQVERAAAEKALPPSSAIVSDQDNSTPESGRNTPQSAATRKRNNERREKERSKLSTVIFTKQQDRSRTSSMVPAGGLSTNVVRPQQEQKDYLQTLFAAQAYSQPRSQPINVLLASAHKTLTTSNHYVDYTEQQDCRILKRIYHLQFANRWSLRQMNRSVEPARPATHWDALLDQAKWMSTDFREERKWKLAAAKMMAHWCAEWKSSSAEERLALQVKVKPSASLNTQAKSEVQDKDRDMDTELDLSLPDFNQVPRATPELVSSNEDDPMSDVFDYEEPRLASINAVAPAAIFSLSPEDINFGIQRTPATDELLLELPLYEPIKELAPPELQPADISPDSEWKTSILPISKYVTGKIIYKEEGPPRKRSRYDYDDEYADAMWDVRVENSGTSSDLNGHFQLQPEQRDVALFNPENKHIRDRIQAGHAFRPPSEFPMPTQGFFESRTSSQWTYTEDDELRKLVKEYSYNWSLIASCLSPPSMFSSGAERRTPWECFERWVGLEGLPADMSKTQYFRAYNARLEAAQRNIMAQQQASQQQQQQQQGNNASQSLTPIRRRTSQPIRVDRRKNTKHLALIDAMRKLAKKRETSIQKQQHAAGLAAMRKANEAAQPKAPIHTPQDFSRMKYERECKMTERAEAYRQQVLAQQRTALQQRSAQQAAQQNAGPTAAVQHQQRNQTAGPMNGPNPLANASLPNGHIQPGLPGQSRAHPPLQAMQNGLANQPNGSLPAGIPAGHQMNMKGVPQAQMQANLQGQQRAQPQMTADNMRVLMEANRVQQEQQRFLHAQRQQQQQHFQGQPQHHHQPGQASPPNLPNNLAGVNQGNPAMLAALQAANNANGMTSPSANVIKPSAGSSASPRAAHVHPSSQSQAQPLSSGMVPTVNNIQHQLKARHPQMSQEQIQKLTSEHLTQQYQQRMSQAAMNAAAGTPPNVINKDNHNNNNHFPPPQGMNGPMSGQSQQLYAQMMRAQQSGQSRGASAGPNGARPPSRSATPQNQRSGSAQNGPGQSPRPPQAQVAGASS